MMIKAATLLCVIPALTGCTAATVMQSEPKYQLISERTADALEECIALAWRGAKVIRGDGHRTLMFGNYATTVASVTITYGSPNTVTVRSKMLFNTEFNHRLQECVK